MPMDPGTGRTRSSSSRRAPGQDLTPQQQILQWVRAKSGRVLVRCEVDDVTKAQHKNKEQREKAYQAIQTTLQIQWRMRWARGAKGQHSRDLTAFPSRELLKLHAGRPKWTSSLIVQLQTGTIGFTAFLNVMRLPGFESPGCTCGHGDMTVAHVLPHCALWCDERRKMIGESARRDLKSVLNDRSGAMAAAKFVHLTKLLAPFRDVKV